MLFYVWEDARVWAHWNHSFDRTSADLCFLILSLLMVHLCKGGCSDFLGGACGKEPTCAGFVRGSRLVPRSGRSPGGGHGNSLQYSCLEKPTDRQSLGSQRAGHDWSDLACTHALQWLTGGWWASCFYPEFPQGSPSVRLWRWSLVASTCSGLRQGFGSPARDWNQPEAVRTLNSHH